MKNVVFLLCVILIGFHMLSSKTFTSEKSVMKTNINQELLDWIYEKRDVAFAEKRLADYHFYDDMDIYVKHLHVFNKAFDGAKHLPVGALCTQLRVEHYTKHGRNTVLEKGLNVGNIKEKDKEKSVVKSKDDCFECKDKRNDCLTYCRKNKKDNNCIKINCNFQKNNTLADGFANYVVLLSGDQSRYKKILKIAEENKSPNVNHREVAKKVFVELKSQGYATSDNYVASLTNIYDHLDMREFDKLYYKVYSFSNEIDTYIAPIVQPTIQHQVESKSKPKEVKVVKTPKPKVEKPKVPVTQKNNLQKEDITWAINERKRLSEKIDFNRRNRTAQTPADIARKIELDVLIEKN